MNIYPALSETTYKPKRITNRMRWAHGNRFNRSKRANFGRLGKPTMRY